MAKANQPASRSRSRLRNIGCRGIRQDVARAADRVDERSEARRIDLAAQPCDENLDHIPHRIEVVVPDVFQDTGAGLNPPGMAKQVLKKRVLPVSQAQHPLSSTRNPLGGDQLQVGEAELHIEGRLGAPRQRSQPGKQLFDREWLGEVIIRACVESGDAIGQSVARGEHQNRSGAASGPKRAADGEPIFSGEPDIQNDEVVFVDREQGKCCCSGHGEVGGPGRFLKDPDQALAQGGIILDDKTARHR